MKKTVRKADVQITVTGEGDGMQRLADAIEKGLQKYADILNNIKDISDKMEKEGTLPKMSDMIYTFKTFDKKNK